MGLGDSSRCKFTTEETEDKTTVITGWLESVCPTSYRITGARELRTLEQISLLKNKDADPIEKEEDSEKSSNKLAG